MWICDPAFLNRKPVQTLHKQFGEKCSVDESLRNRHMLVRCAFAAKAGEKLILHITADDYYKLYINGKMVGAGPAQAYADRFGPGWRKYPRRPCILYGHAYPRLAERRRAAGPVV